MPGLPKTSGILAISALLGLSASSGLARDSSQANALHTAAQPAPLAEPTLDPEIRALLVGLAASLLREAASSPDPVGALSEALERKLALALRSPEFARLAEALIAQAVKDAPAELREPLAMFAVVMLKNLRREMLDGVRPRAPY